MSLTKSHGIHGLVAAGWESVADAFRLGFESGEEAGAAVAVYVDGAPVIDLWGGTADTRSGAVWNERTVVPIFSTTKGVASVCVHLLIERGQLELDAPVAYYWPEFGEAGKQDCTVRWLMSHRAGLSVLDADLTFSQLAEVRPVLQAIEQQRPKWQPGTQASYHAVTFGHLVGELVRRITGVSLGTFIQDELVRPLGLQAWLGLPKDEPVDLARLEIAPVEEGAASDLSRAITSAQEFAENARRAVSLGSALPADFVTGAAGDMNDRDTLALELGGVNMVSDARSLARLYAATVTEVDGVRLFTEQTSRSASALEVTKGPYWGLPEVAADALLGYMPIGVGFMLSTRLGPSSYGHGGHGGSLAFADLDQRVGFAYVMNRLGPVADPRAPRIVSALAACL